MRLRGPSSPLLPMVAALLGSSSAPAPLPPPPRAEPGPSLAPAPLPRAEPSPSEWIVVGLRGPEEASIAGDVEELRRALAAELGPNGSKQVLSAQAVLSRLGATSAPVSALLTRISDAEGAYQQFSLDAAREKFQAGIQELSNAAGEPSVWEASKTAHVLLAMVYLAAQERDATAHARGELEAILRVAPDFRASGYSSDPMFLALAKKAEERVRRVPKGALRVGTEPPRPGVQVWVDTAPRGSTERIELPAGTYRVRVTDESAPRLRSFTHVVTVTPGQETTLTVNLDVEGALDSGGGPAFVLPQLVGVRAPLPSVLGSRLGSGRMVFFWFDGQRNLRLAMGDASTGRLDKAVAVPSSDPGSRAEALANLASYAVSGKLAPGLSEVVPMFSEVRLAAMPAGDPRRRTNAPTVLTDPTAPPLTVMPSPEGGVEGRGPGLKIGGWVTASVALVAAGLGTGLFVHAANGRAALDGPFTQGSEVLVPYPSQADYASQRRGLATVDRWGVGLMIGAGVAAAVSAILFGLDAMPGEAQALHAAGGRAPGLLGPLAPAFTF